MDSYQQFKDLENSHPDKNRLKSIEYQYSIYTDQSNRTKSARAITSIIC